MMKLRTLWLLLACANGLMSQTHWESIVPQNGIFKYYVAVSEGPGEQWTKADYDDASWASAMGGIGKGDDDDSTIVEGDVRSLYLRKSFEVSDTMSIVDMMLYMDYDDGFIAYLNGTELARSSNVIDDKPAWNTNLMGSHEAGEREPYFVSPALLKYGTNTLAVQIVNLTPSSSDLSSNINLNAEVLGSRIVYNELPSCFEQTENVVFESHLPIITINTRAQEIPADNPRIEARMGVMNNEGWNVSSDTTWEFYGRISIEKRGHSSNMFPKKSYSVETQSYKGENFNVSLLGMPKENDWVLYAPYTDKTMMRNDLAYHLGNETGRWSPRTAFCELIIDDDYQGIYLLTEKIKPDKERLDISKLKSRDNEGDELTGGYILKADWPEHAWASYPYGGKSFNINYYYPSYDDITAQQKSYIVDYMSRFEHMMAGEHYADSVSAYAQWIDVQSFVDYQLINEFSKNTDAYMLSSYFYKDKDSKGGKLTLGPLWDYNLAFGNCNFREAWDPVGWTVEATGDNVRPFWYARLMQDPYYRSDMKRRWNELRATIFNEDYIFAYLDDKVDYLGAAIERNQNKWNVIGKYVWPNKNYGYTYAEDVQIMKDFISERITWMDAQIAQYEDLRRPVVAAVDELLVPANVAVYPNPVADVLYVSTPPDWGQALSIRLVNMTGKVLFSQTLGARSSVRLDVGSVANYHGVLFYEIHDGARVLSTGKLIKK